MDEIFDRAEVAKTGSLEFDEFVALTYDWRSVDEGWSTRGGLASKKAATNYPKRTIHNMFPTYEHIASIWDSPHVILGMSSSVVSFAS